MIKKIVITSLAAVTLAACAAQAPLLKVTKSGKPEGEYPGKAVEKVRDALVTNCNMSGLTVYEAEKSVVVCGGATGSTLQQMIIGNAYSTPVEAKTRFTIVTVNKTPKVWADIWYETQMVGGQLNTVKASNNEVINQVQSMLDSLVIE